MGRKNLSKHGGEMVNWRLRLFITLSIGRRIDWALHDVMLFSLPTLSLSAQL